MLLLCYISFATLYGDDCAFDSTKVYPAADLVKCIRTLPKGENDKEINIFQEHLLNYMNQMAFKDILQNPPSPHESLKINITEEILKIKPADYDTASDYYEEFQTLIKKMKDVHTLYTPPCRKTIYFSLPYQLDAQPAKDGSDRLEIIAHAMTRKGITAHYLNEGGEDILDLEITRIALSGNVLPKESAAETIAQWADDNVPDSKDSTVNFFRAINVAFSYRQASRYAFPREAGLFVEYRKKDDTLATVTLPYYGIVTKTTKTLDDICPIYTNKTTSQQNTPKFKTTMDAVQYFAAEAEKKIVAENEEALIDPTINEADMADDDDYELVTNEQKILAYFVQSKKLAFIKFENFAPEDYGVWCEVFSKTLLTFLEKNATDLVLDVRSNGGGIVALGMLAIRVLCPNIFPQNPHADVPVTKYNHYLLDYPDGSFTKVNPKTGKEMVNMTWYDGRGEDQQYISVSGQKYTAQYVKPFEMDFSDPEAFPKATLAALNTYRRTPNSPLFERDHFYVVTDGLCGSTCGMLVKHLHEAHVARFIGVGGSPRPNSDPLFEAASFSGATVMDSEMMLQFPEFKPGVDMTKYPPPFIRESTLIRWAMHKMFAFEYDDREKRKLLEFKSCKVDRSVKYFANPSTKTVKSISELLAQVEPEMGKCVLNEVSSEREKCAKQAKIPHSVFGYACNASTGAFTTGKCVFARCEDGYYLTKGKCVSFSKGKDYKIPTIIAIVAFFAAFIIVSIIVIALGCWKTRKIADYTPIINRDILDERNPPNYGQV
ncbi:hypothetical protein BLNAU_15971 [Blattamonas nauphoetae]|uniref:Tail specific protease domain-containing protein n=1 Tax=Blattamonas nauphoetae TaxID=2049346 RepID=A0ABQ9XCQ4_9EUKA|nr:hypothetical protein BLNAU_15971 [Blattamonas nauphoetae]